FGSTTLFEESKDFTEAERQMTINLSRSMMAAWASFAENGEPKLPFSKPDAEVKWTEAFTEANGDLLNFLVLKVDGEGLNMVRLNISNENCSAVAFWKEKLISLYSSGRSEDNSDDDGDDDSGDGDPQKS